MFNSIWFMIFALVTIILIVQDGSCYPSGPPLSTCSSLQPLGHLRRGSSQDLGYKVISPVSFNPGETIQMRIGGAGNYKGIILQVRKNNLPIGRFEVPRNFQTLRCPGQGNRNTVGHRNRLDKNAKTSLFQWEAPSDCNDGETFLIRATVVQRFESFQTGLTRELTCRHPPTTPTVITATSTVVDEETTPAPPACMYSMRTRVPDGKYNTSFEEEGDLNGWLNQVGWVRNSGRTPTPGTGPNRAADGDYYMYFSANGESPRAILSTARDVRGCFCITIQHNHRVRDNSGHTFVVSAGTTVLYRTVRRQRNWRELKFQVDSRTLVRVRIVARRGRNMLGDTAIDALDIVPGPCRDDEEESMEGEGMNGGDEGGMDGADEGGMDGGDEGGMDGGDEGGMDGGNEGGMGPKVEPGLWK